MIIEQLQRMQQVIPNVPPSLQFKRFRRPRTIRRPGDGFVRPRYSRSTKLPADHNVIAKEQNASRLVRLLHETFDEIKDKEGDECYFDILKTQKGRILNFFFASAKMRRDFQLYRDVVFVNRRFLKTRFKRN